MSSPRPHRESGQVLVLFAGGLLAFLIMVAFVVDGGNAYAQQRISQNASDASAEAGATVLADNLGGASNTDQDVEDAVEAAALANGITIFSAEYTDIVGNSIGVAVGSLGAGAPPSGASGVEVIGDRQFDTFIVRIAGLDQFTARTNATAITGYRSGVCAAQNGCVLLPVTIPINILTCDGQNNPQVQLPPAHWGTNIVYRIPLCKNGPGNVGWLDWTPPGGGTSELVDAIIPPPYNPSIDLPSWQFVTETGNVNSAGVQSALRTYDGQPVYVPIFDSTCDDTPTGPGIADCPAGHTGGNGQNQWYHLPEVAVLQLCGPSVPGCGSFTHGAYVSGNNESTCEVGGNGATSCLVGRFVNFIDEGTVGPLSATPVGPSSVIAVQLIE